MLIPVALSPAGAALNATASVAQRAESRIAVVEPVMIIELPLTIVALAAAVAVFVAALVPEGGDPSGVGFGVWLLAGGLTAGVGVVCLLLGRRSRRSRAALLGIATGATERPTEPGNDAEDSTRCRLHGPPNRS
jgi:hypothetical protein